MPSPSTVDRAVIVGRFLLSVPFIVGAGQALTAPGPLPEFARRSGLPRPELLTRAAAGAMLAGGLAVGTSIAPVAGGVVLAGSLASTTLIVHSFWRDTDVFAKAQHRRAFISNCGLLGGVIAMTAQAYGLRVDRARQLSAIR